MAVITSKFGKTWVIILGLLYFLILNFGLIYFLIELWPAVDKFQQISHVNGSERPSGQDSDNVSKEKKALSNPPTINFLKIEIRVELAIIMLVAIFGAFGGGVNSMLDFIKYVGEQKFDPSWVPKYFLLPVIGMTLSITFYLVIGGGLFSPNFSSSGIRLYGFFAVAILVGIFSENSIAQLRQIAEIIFVKKEDKQPEDNKDDSNPSANPDTAPDSSAITDPSSVPDPSDVTDPNAVNDPKRTLNGEEKPSSEEITKANAKTKPKEDKLPRGAEKNP